MPYINRPPKAIKKKWDNNRKRNRTEKEKLRVKLYNNKKWKKLREGYLISHPLCEKCLEQNRVTPATSCHHLNSPFDDGLTEEERIGRLMNVNNIIAICHRCHGLLHHQEQIDKNDNKNKIKI